MHILFLTWRDPTHPHAGGAERVMYQYARSLILAWHEVTWFASGYPWAQHQEQKEGITYIRQYHEYTISVCAPWWYRHYKKQHTVDVVIDEAGGFPMLSVLFAWDTPRYFFIHHVMDGEFDRLGWPLRYLSRLYYRTTLRLYRKMPTITVSPSTRDELVEQFGFGSDTITIIANGRDPKIPEYSLQVKGDDFAYIGRLTRAKRVEDALWAYAENRTHLSDSSRLHVIGGEWEKWYAQWLHQYAEKIGITDRIVWHGHTDPRHYGLLLTNTRAVMLPSRKEWYGLVVNEVNMLGIPVMAYDVPGLRDSIQDGVNGWLVPDGDREALRDMIARLIHDTPFAQRMRDTARAHVLNIPTWQDQSLRFQNTILPSWPRSSL